MRWLRSVRSLSRGVGSRPRRLTIAFMMSRFSRRARNTALPILHAREVVFSVPTSLTSFTVRGAGTISLKSPISRAALRWIFSTRRMSAHLLTVTVFPKPSACVHGVICFPNT